MIEVKEEFTFDTKDYLMKEDMVTSEDQENFTPLGKESRKFTEDEQLKPQIFKDIDLKYKAHSTFIRNRS